MGLLASSVICALLVCLGGLMAAAMVLMSIRWQNQRHGEEGRDDQPEFYTPETAGERMEPGGEPAQGEREIEAGDL